MRARVRRAVLSAVAIALAMFLIPLGVAGTAFLTSSTDRDLERAALEAAFRVGPTFSTGDPVELPREGAVTIGFYTPAGRRVGGGGPVRFDGARAAARQLTVSRSLDRGTPVIAVPVVVNESVIGVVRAATTTNPALGPTILWDCLAGIALLVILGSSVLARRAATHLATPVEHLAGVAATMGEARLLLAFTPSGIDEIDAAHRAIVGAGERIADLLEREQRIAADASHQLRTPLAGLRAGIEVALSDPTADQTPVLRSAIVQVDRMDATITRLIAVARGADAVHGSCALDAVVEERLSVWQPYFDAESRALSLRTEDRVPTVAVTRFAATTMLDVLIENALRHASGDVELILRVSGSIGAVDITDGGRYTGPDDPFADGESGNGGSGLGLGIAQRIAIDAGGRIVLTATDPRTRFSLLLPFAAAPPLPS